MLGLAHELDALPALGHLFEEHSNLQSREVSSEAEVRAVQAKGHVVVGRAVGTKLIRVLEMLFVVVG